MRWIEGRWRVWQSRHWKHAEVEAEWTVLEHEDDDASVLEQGSIELQTGLTSRDKRST